VNEVAILPDAAAGRISDSEAVELVGEAHALQAVVAAWLAEHHPGHCREP
jgi:hypothetical protein